MSPNDADKAKNAFQVRLALENHYERERRKSIKPKFKIGDYVR